MEQQTEALLKILELGEKEIEEGRFQPAEEFFSEMEKENQDEVNSSNSDNSSLSSS